MAGVDTQNQFPNSAMARAVKIGQSRFMSADVPSIPMGEENNVTINPAATLTVPAALAAGTSGEGLRPTYAVVTATGGPLYYTIDGSVPTATNNAGQVATGGAVPFYGLGLLLALRVFGTTMNVGYYR
jgi:hypothetical protein